MGLKNVIEDFFSDEAGQERRAWLSGKEEQFGNALNYALGPDLAPRVNALANVGAMISPGADVMEARQAGSDMFAPDRSALDRAGSAAAMVGAGAMMLMPGGASSVRQGVDSLVDAGMRAYDPNQVNALNYTRRPDAYSGDHTAPLRDGDNAPSHELGAIYPDDIYSPKAVQYYGTGDDAMDRATMGIIQGLRDNPGASVPIYRAVPSGVEDINAGDWVSVNKQYAVDHGESYLGEGYNVLEESVRADDLFTDGNSIHEFGWDPAQVASLGAVDDGVEAARQAAAANPGDEQLFKDYMALRRARDAPQSPAQTVASMLREGRGAEVTDEMYAAADPTELHRLYTEGATGADMPMDTPSRMARADGMGFDTQTPLYHGTGADFPAFSQDESKIVGATYSDADPSVASAYSKYGEDPQVYPIFMRAGNPVEDDLVSWEPMRESGALQSAKDNGNDAYYAQDGRRIAFDPTNIRSQFARFDPRLGQLGNLSAGVAGAGAVGIAAQQRQPEQRRELPPLAPELAFMKDIYR